MKEKVQLKIYQAFQEKNPNALKTIFQALFSSIPHDWYRKNKLSKYEGYYASVFYCYFTALGLSVTPEDTTNHGRIDMTVQLDDNTVYIFEFKVVDIDKTREQLWRKSGKKAMQTSSVISLGITI